MVDAAAVDPRQRAKRTKATAEEEEEGKTPPPASVRWPRQPTPDHPPYCWMIGEAIDALGEDGGSAEDSISVFIRAAHPGVPAAHDRFLRHYLAKHVAEGFFVCTAPGRYARSTDEAAALEASVEPAVAGPSEAARVEPPVVQVKRGRGRPRKDGSSSTSPAVKKDGRAGPAAPRRRGRPRGTVPLTASDGSVPSSSVAAASAEKNGSQGTASAPRRRRRLRKLATTIDASGEALATDNEEDGIGVSGPMPPIDKQDCDEAASFSLALVVKQDGICTTSTAPEASGQACELALVAEVKKARGKTLSATPKARGHSRQGKLALVATGAHSAPTSVIGKTAGTARSIATLKLTPVTTSGGNGVPSVAHGQPSRLYPLTDDEIPDDPSWCLLALPAVASA